MRNAIKAIINENKGVLGVENELNLTYQNQNYKIYRKMFWTLQFIVNTVSVPCIGTNSIIWIHF